ncbi:MAG: outer membrane protein assembly factor BamD [Myxococcota bacterium]|jgi:outer membrane protein assembly factor BamD|nr:outer membrane protein assembly factor BamD [Myxococcota bacterium]
METLFRIKTRDLFVAALLSVSACAFATALTPTDAHAQADNENAAKKAFDDAERSFRTKDYIEAIRRYNLLRTRFPYSGWATLADLRIADAYFEQEKYATAIEQYRAFAKLHPEHERVTYSNWRVALSFYEQMPEDWFFLPPGYERDLDRAKDAERELRFYLRRNPNSEYDKDATRKLLETRRRLADHELYVAEFYIKRENPRAAALRLTYLLKNYSGLGLDPKALFLLARAYMEMGDVDKATTALGDLIEVHPDSDMAAKARAYLRRHNLRPPQQRADKQ